MLDPKYALAYNNKINIIIVWNSLDNLGHV